MGKEIWLRDWLKGVAFVAGASHTHERSAAQRHINLTLLWSTVYLFSDRPKSGKCRWSTRAPSPLICRCELLNAQ